VGIHNELSQIRVENQSTTKHKVFFVCAITIGVILGLAAKLVDAQGIHPIFDGLVGV